MRNIRILGLNTSYTAHSVLCIGRNYAEHAKELNNPLPIVPVVFTKPLTAITYDGGEIRVPADLTKEVHHEVEMVVAIGAYGRFISEDKAMDYVSGYGVGIDVTARDLQKALKEKSQPWTLAKGMDTFAPIGNFVQADQVADPGNLSISLEVNGQIRQQGNTSDMIFSLPALISFVSQYMSLHKGDLLFTGTPAGVGPLKDGDVVSAQLGDGLSRLNVNVKYF
jgi:2-keto-4-pentenoate hydratase/2-oxohepta-3-ene-1,7-dioic acid hydratase in catechol pathway